MTFEPTTLAGRAGLAAIIADPGRALVAFDYDGTLAPIVADPARAVPHPAVVAALAKLAPLVRTVAVVTGRPAQVAVALGGFARRPGLEHLVVLGHYGLERWSAATGDVTTLTPPPGLELVREELPGLLESLGAAAADIEDKGLSVAVHVRRLPDPSGAYAALEPALRELAERAGLIAEPGRLVIELRPPGMDKGAAVQALLHEVGAASVMFAGDDLGDLAAFEEVHRLRGQGIAGLLVCSGSEEVATLAERADLVVDGPQGVALFVGWLAMTLAEHAVTPPGG